MGRQKRGTVQISDELCVRVQKIISSGRFGISSRARAVEMALNDWLPVKEAQLKSLQE